MENSWKISSTFIFVWIGNGEGVFLIGMRGEGRYKVKSLTSDGGKI